MKLASSNQFFSIILLSFSLLISMSCKKTVESFSDLYALRAELIQEYKEQDINVVIQNSHVLGISFINSSFNNLGELEKGDKAVEIAFFAKSHFRSISTVDQIWVSFIISNNYIVFHYSETVGAFLFETRNLTRAGMTNTGKPQEDAIASYNPGSNETNVYLKENLQLYAASGSNVMLLPHFIVSCESVAAPERAVPESVTLDFTTSSTRRMFEDNPPLVIYVDAQKVFSGRAQVTNVMGSTEEKSVNEFLSQEISYGQFLQLTKGERVRINLGAKEFQLTAEQLKALQSLRKRAEEVTCP